MGAEKFHSVGRLTDYVAAIGHGGGSWLVLVTLSICAIVMTVLICSMSSPLGNATRLLDRPDANRKLHVGETPLVGGLAMMIPTLFLSIFYVIVFHAEPFMNAAVFASSIVLLIGVLDDRLALSPAWRLLALFYVVFVAFSVEPLFVIHSINLSFFGLNFSLPLHSMAAPLTLLMIVGFVNAVNLADGMNGQLLGSVLIWSLLLIRYIGPANAMPFAALFCSAAITLVFNLRGKLFTGSSGAYSGALFIGLCAIIVYRRTPSNLAALTVAMWFWLPVLDCLRLMAMRLRASRSPFEGDREHLHHILLSVLPHGYALAAYLALLGVPALMAEIDPWLGQVCLVGCVSVYAALVSGALRPVPKFDASRSINAAE